MPSNDLPFIGTGLPQHPDRRLSRRQLALQACLRKHPQAPIPSAVGCPSATYAGYALLRNSRVDWLTMLEPHMQETAEMASGQALLILHDSSNIVHSTAKNAKDTYTLVGKTQGYVLHTGLAVREADGVPLGLLSVETLDRTAPDKRRDNEADRWAEGALNAAKRLTSETPRVHLMDREADSYDIFAALDREAEDFIIRARSRRKVQPVGTTHRVSMKAACADIQPFLERTIEVSARKKRAGPPKSGQAAQNLPARTAKVIFRACRVVIFRPKSASKSSPRTLELTLVEVLELDPPEGIDPVYWRLWTSLPARTASEVSRVVDGYRGRWQVEDLYKALKTGCQFEKRRFESKATSQRALGLYLPIAVHLLRLRGLSRSPEAWSANDALPGMHLKVLQQVVPGLPRKPTARQALLAVARLGGHLPANGKPGWLVLGRGYELLDTMTQGWKLARKYPPENTEVS